MEMNTAITQKEVMNLPPLVEGHSIYKLIVPEKVEEKIRYLIRKFPNTEWSGVLFCTHKGSFENNDLVITCHDVYPMDLGNSGWTEFRMSEDVTAYMAENIELFNCDLQLIHSHHHLGAFFSSQDDMTLRREGNDTNCFVSLIVDTEGTYVARITRKILSKLEVTVKDLGTSYEFFGEGSKVASSKDTMQTQTINKEYIEYFNMEVERHEVPNNLSYLDARFAEIEEKKNQGNKNFDCSAFTKGKTHKESDIFEENKPINSKIIEGWTPDAGKVHAAVVRMVTCSLIINPDKVDLKKWVSERMVDIYKKIFGRYSDIEAEKSMNGAFCEWKDYITQSIVDYFDFTDAPVYMWDSPETMVTKTAEAIRNEIAVYKDCNPYMESYYNALCNYVVQ